MMRSPRGLRIEETEMHTVTWPDSAGREQAARSRVGARGRKPGRPARELPCRAEPELFFAEHPDDLLRAKMLCRDCPMRSACLAGALQRGEPCGVWGGELLLRGTIIAGKRPRGRPRKVTVAA
jgi:WhiB family transcriptional regulator, redox-sensing transcriptional regulator